MKTFFHYCVLITEKVLWYLLAEDTQQSDGSSSMSGFVNMDQADHETDSQGRLRSDDDGGDGGESDEDTESDVSVQDDDDGDDDDSAVNSDLDKCFVAQSNNYGMCHNIIELYVSVCLFVCVSLSFQLSQQWRSLPAFQVSVH